MHRKETPARIRSAGCQILIPIFAATKTQKTHDESGVVAILSIIATSDAGIAHELDNERVHHNGGDGLCKLDKADGEELEFGQGRRNRRFLLSGVDNSHWKVDQERGDFIRGHTYS